VSEEHDDLSAADEALRVLRSELSVAPSPDLQTRVRARIAQRREPATPWGWLVPAAAAAVLLIGVMVWMRTHRTDRTPDVAVESPAPPPTVAHQTPAPTPSAEPVRAPRRAAAPRTAARPAIEPIRPIVPPGEEMRIARYVASVRRRPFEADTLPESDPRVLLAEPAPIGIAPLSTAPLVPDEGSPR
jgi:hypothetical protein